MAWPFGIEGTVVVIVTVGTQLVLLVNAFRQTERQREMRDQQGQIKEKVEMVHKDTNSRMSRMEGELTASRAETERLVAMLHASETTRVALAHEASSALARKEERDQRREPSPEGV